MRRWRPSAPPSATMGELPGFQGYFAATHLVPPWPHSEMFPASLCCLSSASPPPPVLSLLFSYFCMFVCACTCVCGRSGVRGKPWLPYLRHRHPLHFIEKRSVTGQELMKGVELAGPRDPWASTSPALGLQLSITRPSFSFFKRIKE